MQYIILFTIQSILVWPRVSSSVYEENEDRKQINLFWTFHYSITWNSRLNSVRRGEGSLGKGLKNIISNLLSEKSAKIGLLTVTHQLFPFVKIALSSFCCPTFKSISDQVTPWFIYPFPAVVVAVLAHSDRNSKYQIII